LVVRRLSRVMRWTILILNLIAVVVLQFLAAYATAAHRTHAYSVFRELEINHALVEKPTYTNGERMDVEARLRSIGSGGYYSVLAHIASAACIITGLVFFFSHAPRRPENAA
jgi:hypothetical protein